MKEKTIPEKLHIKDGLILCGLFSIILLLPLLVYSSFEKEWQELTWQNPLDLSMLEWTGAFLNIFIFLLLLEQFRQSKVLNYIIAGCGFLAMGIVGFFYVFNTPGTEFSLWIKGSSLFLGGVIFSLCLLFRNKTSKNLLETLVKFISPTIFVSCLCCWLLHIISPILPSLLQKEGLLIATVAARLFFITIALLFYISGVYWLRTYMRTRKQETLALTILILVFAQMAVVVNYVQIWGVLWWGWHIVSVLNVFIGSLYLLVNCVRRSLIWRLLLSLALTFGITIVISCAIVQIYTDKIFEKILIEKLHDRHRQLMMTKSIPIQVAKSHIRSIRKKLEKLLSPELVESGELTGKIVALINDSKLSLPDLFMKTVINIGDENYSLSSMNLRGVKVEDAVLNNSWRRFLVRQSGGAVFTDFNYDEDDNVLDATLALPIKSGGRTLGYIYNSIDVSELRKGSIIPARRDLFGEGRLIVNNKHGEIIYASLPPNLLRKLKKANWESRDEGIIQRIAARYSGIGALGGVGEFSFLGGQYCLFADSLPKTDLLVIDIVDKNYLPVGDTKHFRYVIIGVGMVSLLVGLIFLMLLLNYQLARPLKKIVSATHALEKGDFSTRIDFNSQNELGILARTFDSMVLQLKKLYEHLEESVKEKTLALQLAEQVNRSQNNFFAKISHSLRTPLHKILSFSHFGIQPERIPTTEKAIEYFKKINNSAGVLLEIIDELIQLVKIGLKQLSLEYSSASLFMIALQSYEELKDKFEEKGLEFDCEKPSIETKIDIDRAKISRVFISILDNAVKFSKENGKITVLFDSDDESVSVSIKDDGPGIQNDAVNLIFKKFVQFDDSRDPDETENSRDLSDLNETSSDTGLGLFICREIITMHKGSISAENSQDGGAIFRFKIPKKKPSPIKNS